METVSFVGYIRVSTERQGHSGLGLEAQRAILDSYAARAGGTVAAVFTEVESGRKSDRPELRRAIAEAGARGAVLLVARLDRLSRNVRFLSGLTESRVAFKCCDLPECDNFTIHLFAALAQKEAELVSARTKAVLAAKKARGHRLGRPENLKPEYREKAWQARRDQAALNWNNVRATELILALRPSLSLRQLAARLNEKDFRTSAGKLHAVRVLCRRAGIS